MQGPTERSFKQTRRFRGPVMMLVPTGSEKSLQVLEGADGRLVQRCSRLRLMAYTRRD